LVQAIEAILSTLQGAGKLDADGTDLMKNVDENLAELTKSR